MNNIKKILILGLPRAGKTTLAKEISKLLNAVWFDADELRVNINTDLGFSIEDREEQSRRMGWLANKVAESGNFCVCSFVCPTSITRQKFGIDEQTFVIFLDTIKPEDSPYPDTSSLFQKPSYYDLIFTEWKSPSKMAEDSIKEINYAQARDRRGYII